MLRTLWNGTLALPYPVPFELLGDNAKGWLQTDYITPSLRLSRGNKGSLFVLTPEPEPDDAELEAYLEPPPPPPPPVDAAMLTRDPAARPTAAQLDTHAWITFQTWLLETDYLEC